MSADATHGSRLTPRAPPARAGGTLDGGAQRAANLLPHHLRLVVLVPAHDAGQPGRRARETTRLNNVVPSG